ncbi:MAG: AAA family ATPase [Candidatus Aminicenantes bacterium]|nr:AAA family ATPase [Candidatus Aminicenantes bacterium]
MNEIEMKKIPYAISDYDLMRRGNYYYVDKTRYIPVIENAGRYLFFIRPRRFGKSLFLAVLHGYYDVQFKENFDELYKNTWIHTHPTEYIMEIMTEWYGNYRFSPKDNVDLFNPDMVLYFINRCILGHDIPDDLIDQNVRLEIPNETGKTCPGDY